MRYYVINQSKVYYANTREQAELICQALRLLGETASVVARTAS